MNIILMTEHLRVIDNLIKIGTLEADVNGYHYSIYQGGITSAEVFFGETKLFEIIFPDIRNI